jgi:peptide/nickel transport system substrate-binding protein
MHRTGEAEMVRKSHLFAVVVGLLAGAGGVAEALAQKPGGILRIPARDSPASLSIHEESTLSTEGPMMAVFNNLVIFDQHVPQNSLQSIVPDLATSWSWSDDGTGLRLALRQGVKWHDGKPFTAADVKCTWDMLAGKTSEKFRINPRKSWYGNLDKVTTNGDYEVTFHLRRPQPSLIALLATGWSPVYPCHISPAQMRQHPIGTGPFKFVELKPNESIKLTRNPDYWKPGRPYLDGIEYTIIRSPATEILAFAAGNFDRTELSILSIPLLKEIRNQVPQAICDVVPWNVSRDLIINPAAAPLDNLDLRRAIALTLDRKAFVDIIGAGQGQIGATLMPPPEGIWGMPPDMVKTLPGYDPDVSKNRAEAGRIMEKLGYGPDKRLKIKVSTRDLPAYRDPAVLLIDQLKEIYIEATLETVDTVQWYPRVMRKEYAIGLTTSENELDDPDQKFYENYVCGADRNYTGYCNPQMDQRIDEQSMEPDPEKRRRLVWEIERMLAEDGARPIIFYPRSGTCRYPHVKGLTAIVNSVYNGWRMEDVWLDK